MPESHELSLSRCEALLRAGVFGRVGFTTPAGPLVVPVNYSVVDSSVIVRTSAHGELARYGVDTVVAFEVDHVDLAQHRGWSVVGRGRAEAVGDTAALERIRAVWEPRPWVSVAEPVWVRIRCTELTGRQIGDGWDPLRDLPYRRVVDASAPRARDL